MKYRILLTKDNRYQVQQRLLFGWWDTYYTRDTLEDARALVQYLKLPDYTVVEVIE